MANGKSENLFHLLLLVGIVCTLTVSVAILMNINKPEKYTKYGSEDDVCTDQQKNQGCFSYCKGGPSGPLCMCVSAPGKACGAGICSDDQIKKGCFAHNGMCSQKCQCGSDFYCQTKLEGTDDCVTTC